MRRKKAHSKFIADGKIIGVYRWDRVPQYVKRLLIYKGIKLIRIGYKQKNRILANTQKN